MDMLDCITAAEIKIATLEDEYLSAFVELELHSWPSTKAKVHKELQPYWLFRDEISVMDGILIKGRIITIPTSLQDKELKQLYINYIWTNILHQHEY